MKKVSKVVSSVISLCQNEDLRLYVLIHSNWGYIVGEELTPLTSLHSVSRGVLYMNIISSCSLIAKGEEPFIISRLNDILPKKGINDLVFRHCSMLKNPPKIEKKRVHKEVSRIDDFRLNNQRLHSAFEDLKTEIQSAA